MSHLIRRLRAEGHPLMKEAADELERVEKATKPRPMKTAPKDGSPILVFFKDHGWMSVRWTDADENPDSEYAHWFVDDHKHGPYPVRGYVTEDCFGWLPLPATLTAPL